MPFDKFKFLNRVCFAALLAVLIAALLTGCPEGESSGNLPEQFKPETVVITSPPADYIWPRSGGTFDNTGVSAHIGPRTFEIDWEASLGEGTVLSPVIDGAGNIYTGVIGGGLVCLDPAGNVLFTFGGGEEPSAVADGLRAQPALGENQIWLATDGGIVCLDFSGSEIWRMESRYLPEGGALNVAVSPAGGLVAAMRNGTILLLSKTGEVKASIRTKGTSPNPAAFDADGNAYCGSSDRNIYRISPEGNLNWTLNGKAAFLAAPVIFKDRLYATCMDGYLVASDMRGRERWRVELIYDAILRERELAKENESFISGLYWSPLLRYKEAAGEQPPVFELIAMFSDRAEKLSDAIYMGAWADEAGERKMRISLAESFNAGAQFGAHPVMDAEGIIYFAFDNRVFAVQGKDVLAEYQINGETAVSGAQLVVAGGERLLLPMNDGRLICFKNAETPADAEESSEIETDSGTADESADVETPSSDSDGQTLPEEENSENESGGRDEPENESGQESPE